MEVKSKAFSKINLGLCARVLGPVAFAALTACGGGSGGGSEPNATATALPSTPLDSSASAASAVDSSVALAASAPASEASAAALVKATAALGAEVQPKGVAAVTTTTSGTNASGSGGLSTTSGSSTSGTGGSSNAQATTATGASASATADSTQFATAPKSSVTTAATSIPPPVVFNSPLSAAAGDIVNLQGENFGTSPTANLIGTDGKVLSSVPALSSYGGISMSFKVPASATGAIIVQVVNGNQASAPVKLNAATPHHLDAMQIAAKGRFRIFGRNLLVPGTTPTVTVDGLAATVDTKNSDPYMLSVTAPAALKASSKVTIQVDNKNGSGPAALDRNIDAVAGDGSDPFGLGVGWGVAFNSIAGRVTDAATDARLVKKVTCNGSTDDGPALQAAILMLNRSNGGVLALPAGTCRVATSVQLFSNVVIQGAGKDKTVIRSEVSNPIWGKKIDLAGWRDLTFRNTDPKLLNPELRYNTRVFVKNVRFELGGGAQMFLADNTNFAVNGIEIVQPANSGLNGPAHLGSNAGFVFTDNTVQFSHGSSDMPWTHDAYVAGNHISRDVRGVMDSPSVVHSLTVNFAHRIAIIGNTFDVIGGSVTNKTRNDGETILTEGGGLNRTENIGSVASATATTLSDPNNRINVNPFTAGEIPENYGVAIVRGKGTGQARRVTGYASSTLSVDTGWSSVPDTTSRYVTFVWGLEKAIIKGNQLSQNPRGIWLYNTAVRDVDIVSNSVSEGGGIYVRSTQILASKMFTPIYRVRIAGNTVVNTTKQWLSYINTSFVRADETDFGLAMIGIDIRNNTLKANSPNLVLPKEEAGNDEGYVVRVKFEGATQALSTTQVRLLGTVLQANVCTGCNVGLVIGQGTQALTQDGTLASSNATGTSTSIGK
jgi:hypothetical protein